MEGGEEGAGAEVEAVLGAGECAVVDVFIVAAVEEVVGSERYAHFVVDVPDCRCVEQDKVGCVAFGEASEKVLCADSELHDVVRYYGCEKGVTECVTVVCPAVE